MRPLAVLCGLSAAAACAADAPDGPRLAGPIPAARLMHWDAGVRGGIPQVPVTATVKLPADGRTDAAPALQAAIDAAKGPGALLLPAGSYRIKSTLRLRSGVVLRGEGPDRTHLLVDIPGYSEQDWRNEAKARGRDVKADFGINRPNRGAIRIAGRVRHEAVTAVTGGFDRGSRRLTPASTAGLKPGRTVWVFQENDPSAIGGGHDGGAARAAWARHAMGQLATVTSVRDGDVTIDAPLRFAFRKALRPRLVPLEPIERAGLEALHIRRLDESFENVLDITHAVNCWVRGCRSEYSRRMHVAVARSRFVTIEGNYIHHAHHYGGGGSAYGVVLRECAGDCLIVNNVLHTLRHALMVKQGATGNVLAYNLSFDAQSQSGQGSSDLSGHGHFANWNLFEGNQVERLVEDAYWGFSGPGQTYFRNRIASAAPVLAQPHPAAFVGNTCPRGPPRGKDIFPAANLVKGTMDWGRLPPRTALPASLYWKRRPDFWPEDKPWPGIGADVDVERLRRGAGRVKLPAEDRYERELMPRADPTVTVALARFLVLPHYDRDTPLPVGADGSVRVRPAKYKRFAVATDVLIARAGPHVVSVRARAGDKGTPPLLTLSLPPKENLWRDTHEVRAVQAGAWAAYSWPVTLEAGRRTIRLVALGNRDRHFARGAAKLDPAQELHLLSMTVRRQ